MNQVADVHYVVPPPPRSDGFGTENLVPSRPSTTHDSSSAACRQDPVADQLGDPSAPLVQYRFGKFLVGPHDTKAMSIVLEALHIQTGRRVVMKRAKTEDKTLYIEKELEFLLVCRGHQNIVQLVEDRLIPSENIQFPPEVCLSAARCPWLVVEHINGGSLDGACVAETSLTLRDILRIAEATAKALEFLHARNILHRDVKPHNVLIERDASSNEVTTVKLADLGISTPGAQDVHTSRQRGTRNYNAPEVFQHVAAPGSDMWSWGCTIVHAATGIAPYSGENKSMVYSNGTEESTAST